MTEAEIRKVLEMPEDEQLIYLNNLWQNRLLPQWFNLQPDIHGKLLMTDYNHQLLALLAFRLRDEARASLKGEIDFRIAMTDVYYAVHELPKNSVVVFAIFIWFVENAQPIHWILAAIQAAKEMK